MSLSNPKISEISENGGILRFRLSQIDMSIANALRRAILTEIPINVIRTEINESNQCTVHVNTSRLHNEIIKQRLSCIPIHVKDLTLLPDNYVLEIDTKNTSDNTIYVTTEDFKLKNKKTGEYMPEEEVHRIFPSNLKTLQFLDFARLRPKISDSIPGEHLKLTAEFSVGNAKENAMYNVVSKCTYGFTPDVARIEKVWEEREAKLRGEEMPEKDIAFQKRNFMILDAQRIYTTNSFDFQIKSIGIFENREIVKKAANILYQKFAKFVEELDSNIVPIINSETTMENCFDILLENEDYTMGKVFEYLLYEKYYEGEKTLDFCGFKKFHPHDLKSTIRIAFKETADKTMAKQYIRIAAINAADIFKIIYKMF